MKFIADKEVRRKRLSTCMECEFSFKNKLCKKCGCVLPVKISVALAKCPINKWER